jgi:plasmid stabilization system protein ParE
MRQHGKKKYKIIWDEPARVQLKKIHEYISRDSLQNAQKVKAEIIKITKSLHQNPDRFPPDKYKDNNDGSYRAFNKYKYRVAYVIFENEIIILRVRSEKQEPLSY